jgi:predicted DNA-binding transcriptional regulator YafY
MQAVSRTLEILRLLREHTDEEHPMSASELVARLRETGADVERRSVYRSLRELADAGYDIVRTRRRDRGVYLGQREFELPEVKLLVDAVQAARFITVKKSGELIRKLMGFVSRAQAEALWKSVLLEDRAKCANEQIYYSIDALCEAIRGGRQISFKYCRYDLKKLRVERRGGSAYIASPYALEWSGDAYYLVCRVGSLRKFTHFRVDRMKDIRVLDEPALPYDDFCSGKLDLGDYGKRAFSMFEGPVEDVRIRFKNRLATAVIDRFGADARIVPDGDEWFILRAELVVSPGLTAWLAHFGGDAELLAPESAREQVRGTLREMLARYG